MATRLMREFDYLTQSLNDLASNQRLRKLVPRVIDGIRLVEPDGRTLLNFGGDDYLGLAAGRVNLHDRSPLASPEHRVGSSASALLCGWTESHQRLADRIASLELTESAVLFPSGYAACSGTVATLAGDGDLILSDQLNHASLIDGSRLSRAQCLVYPHCDWREVNQMLQRNRDQFRRVWIVTNGVFGMDGHVAPLDHLVRIADQQDACLVVDEAHGTGVLGESGSGACEAMGVKDRVSIRIGTLSKAVGSQGGFVAGPKVVVDYLINRCRSLIYSTSLAMSAVSAAIDGIDQIRDQPEKRERVQQLAMRVRRDLSIDAGSSLETLVPIVSVVVGEDQLALALSQSLAARGLYVPAIRPPTVAEGTARLRISLSAAHEDEMIHHLVSALNELL